MTTTTNSLIAALNLPEAVPALLKTSASITTGLTGNAYFPSAGPLITALNTAQQNLTTAEAATKTRTRGTVGTRNQARLALLAGLRSAKVLVQQAADADPAHAETIIASAGMSVRKASTARKPPFAALQGTVSGSVKLVARAAGNRASYEWQYSPDGGHTWTLLPSTLQAKTTATGIPAGTNGQFRYRAVTKTGQADWSQTLSLIVK